MIETACKIKECIRNNEGKCTKRFVPMIVDNTKTINTIIGIETKSNIQGKCVYPEIKDVL